eukprot:3854662-Pyramimonas_sp.AAC.2
MPPAPVPRIHAVHRSQAVPAPSYPRMDGHHARVRGVPLHSYAFQVDGLAGLAIRAGAGGDESFKFSLLNTAAHIAGQVRHINWHGVTVVSRCDGCVTVRWLWHGAMLVSQCNGRGTVRWSCHGAMVVSRCDGRVTV